MAGNSVGNAKHFITHNITQYIGERGTYGDAIDAISVSHSHLFLCLFSPSFFVSLFFSVSLFFLPVLHGLDLESKHCMFENQTGTVTLIPLNGAQCSVNGVQVTEPAPLNQGTMDRSTPRIYTFDSWWMVVGPWPFPSDFNPCLFVRCCHPARQNKHVSFQPP